VLVYLDTEYHGGRRAQRLLSLGLVTEDGRWFYGELPQELARVKDHDDFFATHVTPQFGRVPGATFADPSDLAAALRAFLAGLGVLASGDPTREPRGALTLACDDRHDPWLLSRLWQAAGTTPPPWSTQDVRGLVRGPADRAGLIDRGPLARHFGLRAHHALADAESLATAAARDHHP
jgi:hypothetical protein